MPAVSAQIARLIREGKMEKQYVTESPYPSYKEPLIMTGDALVLPDLEMPFHNAEFINKVLWLAEKWGIKQCILAGDVLHFDSLTGWDPSWHNENRGGITAEAEKELMKEAEKLPAKYREQFIQKIAEVGIKTEQDGLTTELDIARRELRSISKLFTEVHFLLGNHEGRYLRALETAISPKELLRNLEQMTWKIAPYYFSYLDTVRGRYQIEHPKGSAEGTAQQLASKFHAHIIMGHSHLLDFSWDISGKFYAIHAGHCVDESRLPYASQRHTTKREHKPGAVIVKDGYPYLLHDGIDWKFLGGK